MKATAMACCSPWTVEQRGMSIIQKPFTCELLVNCHTQSLNDMPAAGHQILVHQPCGMQLDTPADTTVHIPPPLHRWSSLLKLHGKDASCPPHCTLSLSTVPNWQSLGCQPSPVQGTWKRSDKRCLKGACCTAWRSVAGLRLNQPNNSYSTTCSPD